MTRLTRNRRIQPKAATAPTRNTTSTLPEVSTTLPPNLKEKKRKVPNSRGINSLTTRS